MIMSDNQTHLIIKWQWKGNKTIIEEQWLTWEPCKETKTKRAQVKARENKLNWVKRSEATLWPLLEHRRYQEKFRRESSNKELYFILFTSVKTRYAYVTSLSNRHKKAGIIDKLLSKFISKWGKPQKWLTKDNAGQYISRAVIDIIATWC